MEPRLLVSVCVRLDNTSWYIYINNIMIAVRMFLYRITLSCGCKSGDRRQGNLFSNNRGASTWTRKRGSSSYLVWPDQQNISARCGNWQSWTKHLKLHPEQSSRFTFITLSLFKLSWCWYSVLSTLLMKTTKDPRMAMCLEGIPPTWPSSPGPYPPSTRWVLVFRFWRPKKLFWKPWQFVT